MLQRKKVENYQHGAVMRDLPSGNDMRMTDLVHRRGGFGRQHPKSVTVNHYFSVYLNTQLPNNCVDEAVMFVLPRQFDYFFVGLNFIQSRFRLLTSSPCWSCFE